MCLLCVWLWFDGFSGDFLPVKATVNFESKHVSICNFLSNNRSSRAKNQKHCVCFVVGMCGELWISKVFWRKFPTAILQTVIFGRLHLWKEFFFWPGAGMAILELIYPYKSWSAPRASRNGFLHEQDARSCSRWRGSNNKRLSWSLPRPPKKNS